MRIFIFLLSGILILGLNSCKNSRKAQNAKMSNCGMLERVKGDIFHEQKTAHYRLNHAKQKGDKLVLNISTDVSIGQSHLYWTGMTRRSYPPQATVKLVLKESPNQTKKAKMKKHELCFDMKDMDNGGLMTIYIMDDEEVVEFDFGKNNSK